MGGVGWRENQRFESGGPQSVREGIQEKWGRGCEFTKKGVPSGELGLYIYHYGWPKEGLGYSVRARGEKERRSEGGVINKINHFKHAHQNMHIGP